MRTTHQNSTLFELFGAWYAPYILGAGKNCRVLSGSLKTQTRKHKKTSSSFQAA
ncbi:hypothetical protein [Alysiella crassa]|uniref:hypothetical protein n=1 Tax=Alysiella crassa TaxID=153491 RepID=UPI001470C09F|nr:hypothetical protein [Alysiella crassa]UOP06365.1 hypothetical protein LVJ80_11305 [Alysiella crassa]